MSPRLALAASLCVAGLTAPAGADEALAKYDARVKPADRAHWAFRPVRPVAVPSVRGRAWVRNPIDAFVLARLEARGGKPNPPAAPAALFRRLHLNLAGLPPAPEEVDAFLADRSPLAFERVLDRLLASPAHGERYGRHWLDLVRYADTNGYERDADKPFAWRFRDYVIRSLNADKPFDRFATEQLAGDELPDADADTVLATGFLRLGPWDDEPADPAADAYDQLDDLVATTSEAFLGLTLACARCHNHKFEPLSMLDYYRAVSVFHPLRRPRAGRTELARPALPPAERATFDQAQQRADLLARAGRGGLLGLPGTTALRQRAALLSAPLDPVPRGYFLEEPSPRPPVTHLLKRGRPGASGPVVQPGVPAVLASRQPAFLPPGEHTTRRRLSLARWMTSADNPLFARVIVNRVWQWHMGEGLVRTPSDLGTRGQRPTHPELLDWLAGELVRSGWSLKSLHRLILTSSTYRMSKRVRPEYAASDPENRLWWRMPYRRVEAEVVRDAVLAASGRLNRQMFGPGVRPPIPPGALEGHSDPKTVWKPDPAPASERRSVYIHVKRSLLVPLVEALDFCDTTRSAARRPVTTVAPQALMLFNGDFAVEQARHLAARLRREAGPDPGRQVERAYRLALGRPPTPRERSALEAFLARDAALEQVCRVVLNLNEMVYPD